MPSDSLQPMRWPSEWTDPALLALIAGSPVNCLLLDAPDSLAAVSAAARKAGVTVLDWKSLSATPLADVKWDAPAAQRVITGLVWPRIRLSAGGRTDQCGWLTDKFGLSWQIVPAGLNALLSRGPGTANRVMGALMQMTKLDIAVLEAAANAG